MNYFIKRRRREPIALQLTAMIDIFSMIVIFLILGTVSDNTSIALPGGFTVPQSVSKESVENANELVIGADTVEFAAMKIKLPMSFFTAGEANESQIAALKEKIKEYSAELSKQNKSESLPLNVLADEKLPYGMLFPVLSVFRQSGFEAVTFVTTPKRSSSL